MFCVQSFGILSSDDDDGNRNDDGSKRRSGDENKCNFCKDKGRKIFIYVLRSPLLKCVALA